MEDGEDLSSSEEGSDEDLDPAAATRVVRLEEEPLILQTHDAGVRANEEHAMNLNMVSDSDTRTSRPADHVADAPVRMSKEPRPQKIEDFSHLVQTLHVLHNEQTNRPPPR